MDTYGKIIDETLDRVDIFDIVRNFPEGYIVWNIGRHNFQHPRYIPLAKPDPNHEFHVLPDELKALEVPSEEEALYILKRAITGDYGAKYIDRNKFIELRNNAYAQGHLHFPR